ncbi:MAG TPA: hypothetical protein DIC34_03910 [Treponema sp.]|nr:hypothetical protein [Treponema sp.]
MNLPIPDPSRADILSIMSQVNRASRFAFLPIALYVLFSCGTTAPAPTPPASLPESPPHVVETPPSPPAEAPVIVEAEPSLRIGNPRASAVDLASVIIRFTAIAVNPASRERTLGSVDYELFVQDVSVARGSTATRTAIPAGEQTEIELELPLSVRELEKTTDIADCGPEATWRVELRARWTSAYEEAQETAASAGGRFPVIREPTFSIVAIKMKRAELINTRLKVELRVNNPNAFPVGFESMSYELFGEGRSWSDGVAEQLVVVAPGGAASAELSMTMNFIDMNRALLDQFIRLEEVRYRLKGEIVVGTGLEFLPEFRMKFDKSGTSAVTE